MGHPARGQKTRTLLIAAHAKPALRLPMVAGTDLCTTAVSLPMNPAHIHTAAISSWPKHKRLIQVQNGERKSHHLYSGPEHAVAGPTGCPARPYLLACDQERNPAVVLRRHRHTKLSPARVPSLRSVPKTPTANSASSGLPYTPAGGGPMATTHVRSVMKMLYACCLAHSHVVSPLVDPLYPSRAHHAHRPRPAPLT